jgi:hypothetical protein
MLLLPKVCLTKYYSTVPSDPSMDLRLEANTSVVEA